MRHVYDWKLERIESALLSDLVQLRIDLIDESGFELLFVSRKCSAKKLELIKKYINENKFFIEGDCYILHDEKFKSFENYDFVHLTLKKLLDEKDGIK